MTGTFTLAAHAGESELPWLLERLRSLIHEIILSSREAGRSQGAVGHSLTGAVHLVVAALEQSFRFDGSRTTSFRETNEPTSRRGSQD